MQLEPYFEGFAADEKPFNGIVIQRDGDAYVIEYEHERKKKKAAYKWKAGTRTVQVGSKVKVWVDTKNNKIHWLTHQISDKCNKSWDSNLEKEEVPPYKPANCQKDTINRLGKEWRVEGNTWVTGKTKGNTTKTPYPEVPTVFSTLPQGFINKPVTIQNVQSISNDCPFLYLTLGPCTKNTGAVVQQGAGEFVNAAVSELTKGTKVEHQRWTLTPGPLDPLAYNINAGLNSEDCDGRSLFASMDCNVNKPVAALKNSKWRFLAIKDKPNVYNIVIERKCVHPDTKVTNTVLFYLAIFSYSSAKCPVQQTVLVRTSDQNPNFGAQARAQWKIALPPPITQPSKTTPPPKTPPPTTPPPKTPSPTTPPPIITPKPADFTFPPWTLPPITAPPSQDGGKRRVNINIENSNKNSNQNNNNTDGRGGAFWPGGGVAYPPAMWPGPVSNAYIGNGFLMPPQGYGIINQAPPAMTAVQAVDGTAAMQDDGAFMLLPSALTGAMEGTMVQSQAPSMYPEYVGQFNETPNMTPTPSISVAPSFVPDPSSVMGNAEDEDDDLGDWQQNTPSTEPQSNMRREESQSVPPFQNPVTLEYPGMFMPPAQWPAQTQCIDKKSSSSAMGNGFIIISAMVAASLVVLAFLVYFRRDVMHSAMNGTGP